MEKIKEIGNFQLRVEDRYKHFDCETNLQIVWIRDDKKYELPIVTWIVRKDLCDYSPLLIDDRLLTICKSAKDIKNVFKLIQFGQDNVHNILKKEEN